MDPRGGLDTEARGKILCTCPGSNLDRPVVQSGPSQTLYWLNYPVLYFKIPELNLPGELRKTAENIGNTASLWAIYWALDHPNTKLSAGNNSVETLGDFYITRWTKEQEAGPLL
jgi:hypothetical protein